MLNKTLNPAPVLAEPEAVEVRPKSSIGDKSGEARESNNNKPHVSRKTDTRLPLPEMGTDSRGGVQATSLTQDLDEAAIRGRNAAVTGAAPVQTPDTVTSRMDAYGDVLESDLDAMDTKWNRYYSHAYIYDKETALCGKKRNGATLHPRPTRELCPICAALSNYG